ncbi:restriction endonuclease subunit S [Bacteroides sp. AN502(2024)]|uniref:restriction endonuclease subunit S n=1 Tax=Bacteroides sp. AN502(2024) TaxID=3160599 RepID=UPI003513ABF2
MKQYASYKPSGTPWIGDMPSHWEKKRLRFVCEFRNGYTPSKANQDFWTDGTIPWYRMEDIRDSGRFLNEAKQYVTEEAVKGQGLFEAGSFILATTATIGEHAMLIVDSLANQRFTNLKIRKSLGHSCLKEFFFYYLFLIDEFCKSSTRTATFPAMNMEDLRNFDVAIPPLAEQEAIAAYLDRKCDSIDKVIATQERRIVLLSELKQSIITEAVTRGLNPDVPLKDSGIDWIGKIPEHWEAMPLKYTANKEGCCFIDGDWIESDVITEDGIRYITTGNVGVLEYKEQGAGYISEETFHELGCTEVFSGDILISRLNEPIGRACILPDLNSRVITSVDNVIFRPDTELYDKSYLVYYLNNSRFTEHANLEARGATMHRMSRTMLGHQQIVVPHITEQRAISDYLEKKCSRIDSAIAKAKRAIELLREFKQSVITEAVTGKIKVC